MSGKPSSRRRKVGDWIKRQVDVLHPTIASPNPDHSHMVATPDSNAASSVTDSAPIQMALNRVDADWVEINLPVANTASNQESPPWAGLRSTLQALKLTSKFFPPLEAIANQLLDCFDSMENTEKDREEYVDLAKDLERILRGLNEYLPSVYHRKMSDEMRRIVRDIQVQVDCITRPKNRSVVRRMVRALKDADEPMKYHRRIGVLFTQLQINLSIGTRNIVDEALVDSRLREMKPAYEASYNSIQSTDVKRRACTENTRVSVLAGIWEWALQPEGPRIYWMNGMAGTGKTTIAYTTCAQLEENKQLGASFFCSRILPSCRDVGRIIPTIAYQLARFLPRFRSQLCQILVHDPDASTRDLTTQFRKLLKEPMKSIKGTIPNNIVVLIDALDELDGSSSARHILKILFENANEMPVKFFVTSRPDHGLYDLIMSQGSRIRDVFHLHEIETSFVQADIGTYMGTELGSLHLPGDQIQRLAEQAGRFFIYAATAVEYIEPNDPEADHGARLTTLLQLTSDRPNMRQQKIDGLYAAILQSVFEKPNRDPVELECIQLVLWSVLCAQEPLTSASLSNLLKLGDGKRVVLALKPLRSVLHISECTGHVSTLHASFPDFMFSRERSDKYACDNVAHHGLLAVRCFEAMKDQLQFNICGIDSAFVLDKQVPNLQSAIDSTISPELFYACQYWGAHLQTSLTTQPLMAYLNELLEHQLLAWMEVLTLKQAISQGEPILGAAERWLLGSDASLGMRQLMHDSWRFVTSFAASPASASTPHIYISALALWHAGSPILKCYGHLIQDWMGAAQTRAKYHPALLATWDAGTGSRIKSVALSPDGTRLVSGDSSFRCTSNVCIWDARTGSVILKQSTTNEVLSVAFSANSARIALGCSDGSVLIWDAITGEPISGPFNCHNGRISCIAFHDDTLVVSSSDDVVINIINPTNGETVIGPLCGHTRAVNSIAVSPNGAYLASGSKDCTIFVWELSNGRNRGTLTGHSFEVLAVAYSPCNTRIVFSSTDRTMRVWDPLTGDVVVGPFGRSSAMVNSVAFSPDGRRVVSGSDDYGVSVYDSFSGQAILGPLQAHIAPVNTIAVSVDSSRIFSGSDDGTICVWDINLHGSTSLSGSNPMPMGHSAPVAGVSVSTGDGTIISVTTTREIGMWDLHGRAIVRSISLTEAAGYALALSPSKKWVALGTSNGDIDIWNVSTGKHVNGPFRQHTEGIYSGAFSLDDTLFISSSTDRTIMIRDITTKVTPSVSLEGHDGSALSVALSHNVEYAAAGTDSNVVCVWKIQEDTSRPARLYKGHSGQVNSIDFSPGGTKLRLVSGSSDCSVRVWCTHTDDVCTNFTASGVNHVKFSPEGTRIVSSSYDRTISVWDATTGELVAGPFQGHKGAIRSVTFSLDSTNVISGSVDQTIRTWTVGAARTSCAPNPYGSIATTTKSDSKTLGSWWLDASGWVLDRTGRLLIWVPRPLRPALGWPCNPLVISITGSLQLPAAGLLDGKIWRELCRRQEARRSSLIE
ncbi:unnamed protein product [Rhizoctonia solani]|uniref:NACHT domain-containing protein n=1 Tax=Rhizoctonia solani TaxID=456999 RepID=A0A8H3EC87_9AGAM|nr:unnamed protein product [Rhizoctonia solani]